MENLRVAVDIVVFTIRERALYVLLVKRGVPPFLGQHAIPDGFLREEESLEDAVLRELYEETGVRDVFLAQWYSFGDPRRDPRGRVITIAYYALISSDRVTLVAGADAAETGWFPVQNHPVLAFDHKEILEYAVKRLRNRLEYTTQTKFPQKNRFVGDLEAASRMAPHRPKTRAQLFQFSAAQFEKLKDKGIIVPF